jgi:hypothetical protein
MPLPLPEMRSEPTSVSRDETWMVAWLVKPSAARAAALEKLNTTELTGGSLTSLRIVKGAGGAVEIVARYAP